MPRLQLRATALVTALLLLGPALVLWRLPRPKAQGLARLLSETALIQSFAANPLRPVPSLWQQRLGPSQALRQWQRQGGLWWQFWGRDGDGGAFLAIADRPGPAAAATPLPPNALRVDDLLVLAPDPLSLRQLSDQLKSSSRQRQGLERRCLERLQQGQAVYWSPLGLAAITGPVAPLLQHLRQGCLSLSTGAGATALRGGTDLRGALALQGEATAFTGLLVEPPRAGQGFARAVPLPPGMALELSGPRLEPWLQGLLSRQLIREPLAARYGFADRELKLLQSIPFQLRLRRIASGAFQAGLELQFMVGSERQAWAKLLDHLRQSLLDAGLQETPARLEAGGAAGTGGSNRRLPTASFSREDGQVVGGWRWLASPGGDPQLLLFLGTEPIAPAAARIVPDRFQLRLRPSELDKLSLIPEGLPLLVRRATSLELVATATKGQPLSQLTGRLQLAALAADRPQTGPQNR
ncbi:MAG TPA: hypothetical protein DDY43_08520 [Synechococcales bacterium UBA10510]|nr:hypothetical protein [Synechococcales bacterium UBA10510]